MKNILSFEDENGNRGFLTWDKSYKKKEKTIITYKVVSWNIVLASLVQERKLTLHDIHKFSLIYVTLLFIVFKFVGEEKLVNPFLL